MQEAVDLGTLARVCRISRRTAEDLAAKGTFERVERGSYAFEASLGNYIDHLREVAAARSSADGELDLVQERALLTREQREGQAIKNAEARKNLLPADAVRDRWCTILASIRAGMLAIVGGIRSDLPHLSEEDVQAIDRRIRNALTKAADDKPA